MCTVHEEYLSWTGDTWFQGAMFLFSYSRTSRIQKVYFSTNHGDRQYVSVFCDPTTLEFISPALLSASNNLYCYNSTADSTAIQKLISKLFSMMSGTYLI